ncbi:MAG: TetR/AcrR family transcriptional regulator [Nitriliruptorales bacterium]
MAGEAAGATTERGRRTAARLRRAARDAFADVGYVNARVDDIVAAADVSHGTFYTYYENKAAVLADLVRSAADRLQAVASEPWDPADEPTGLEDVTVRETIERVIGRFLSVYAQESDVVRAWVEAAAVDGEFGRLLTKLRSGFVDRIAENLAPAAFAGGHDPRTAASALVAMVEGYVIEHPDEPQAAPAEVVRTLAAIWHGGLLGLTRANGA